MYRVPHNAGEGIKGRWTLIVIGLIFVSSQHGCHSDFHVILPETCNLPDTFNLTWIRSMVNLGIREEQTHIILNIIDRKDICDGSKGLLKFISIAHSDPEGKMIASLEPHLCPTATTFSRSHRKQFISWTCSQHATQNPGVISLKPQISDVILAIQRMLRYSRWDNVAITKSRFDKSRFCDDVGAYLQQEMKDRVNKSVIVLGNYEDLEHHFFSSITHNLNALFFCISYDYGFTHNLSRKTELKSLGASARKIPLVLLPEWPLPVDIFTPPTPTLALVANSYPRVPTTSSFDFQPKNWDPVETSSESTSPLKQLETLLAQMILKSVKLSLERDLMAEAEEREATTITLLPSTSTGASGSSIGIKNSSPQTVHQRQQQEQLLLHTNGKQQTSSSSKQEGPPENGASESTLLEHQFLFSILQYEKARWHPLINLVNGEKHFTKGNDRSSTGVNYKEEKASAELKSDYLLTWFKVVLAILVMGLVVLGSIVVIIYFRARTRGGIYKDRKFYTAKQCRKLSIRHRGPGPYKILLKSSDITYDNGATPENTKRSSKSPFIGNLSAFQRSSQEKPDLLKGSFGGSSSTLRKQSSVTNIKNESGTLTGSTLGDRTARYKGDVVFLKKIVGIPTTEPFEVKIKAMLVLETLHGLRHENLVAMLGCLTEETPALVWEYCSRGSLYDIIKQKDIKLDWAFKLSLLTDLVRGMRYLHSSMIRCHGFLSSHNCVIDARWVLKITDYGMPALYQHQGLPYPSKPPKELLWTAPELLRDETLRRQGTQTGDVYSFAILMQEVLVRGEPFCMLTLTPEEILEKLKRPPPLIRPSVSKGSAPPEAVNIMRQCWAELPDMRPDFMVIHDLFKTLNHGRKANIVDTMFQMLEKYSNNLEELIRERTEQLDLEKKKTEQLLNRMLPNTVAEKLKLGLPVDPEEFQEVTIYFSDIVGFTTISAYSTPFEVVDLLNDLYTCFDATINDYNVYKVETIGDAYMCVGGAPIWAPDHADQIATMALDLLHQSGKFRIRHLPFTPLRLRIGLHTGSCCAGVVGLTMPRYCLFGDTVNTASRMESTGAPWRIHISSETKAKLDEAGGYITEYRGITEIKGKGPMHTYWLLGKEGFDKELPTPPGLSENHGLDENSIKYGRTGIMPAGSESVAVEATEAKSSSLSAMGKGAGVKSNQVDITTVGLTTGNSTLTSSANLLAPPKVSSSFGFVSGENVRSLSPAEQVAHQLLNGRPTTKGLRRQLSLDHKVMPVVLRAAHKATIRRAPSLEENLESTSSLNIPLITTTSRSESQSSRTSILKHSPSPSQRMVSFEEKSSGSNRDSKQANGEASTTTTTTTTTTLVSGSSSEEESRKRSETVVKVETINNNLSSSMSKKSTEPIPSSRKSLLRNEISSVPLTSFDPSEKFHNSIIVEQHDLTSMSNSAGENTLTSVCIGGTSAVASGPSSCSSNSSGSLHQPAGQQNITGSSSSSSSSALSVAPVATTGTKINTNFPGFGSPQQPSSRNINSVSVTAITNTLTSTSTSTTLPAASTLLPNELIVKNNGSSTMITNNIIITSADSKLRMSPKKLAKVLSVVEESPKMERKYEISSPNPV